MKQTFVIPLLLFVAVVALCWMNDFFRSPSPYAYPDSASRRLEVLSAPPILTNIRHRGARYNLTAMRLNMANRNFSTLSRFNTIPLKPPPPPTERSCLLPATMRHKILLFVDHQFFTHFLNWKAHYIDVCGEKHLPRLEIICMDQAVVEKVETEARMVCSPHSFLLTNETFHFKHQIVWRYRMTIIVRYLQQDVSLLLSDLDALWRNDPYPDFVRYLDQGHSIIASRGLWPQDLSDRWGAALCMGFIFIRSSPVTTKLMQDVLELMQETTPDDQKAINTILFRRNITWSQSFLPLLHNPDPDIGTVVLPKTDTKEASTISSSLLLGPFSPFGSSLRPQHNTITTTTTAHDVKTESTTILLLPHNLYMRNCSHHRTRAIAPIISNRIRQRIAQVTVAHCVAAPGNAYKKFLHLQYMGMWHEGVPIPLKNETQPKIPNDSLSRKMGRARVSNSTAAVLEWRQTVMKELEAFRARSGSSSSPPPLLFARAGPAQSSTSAASTASEAEEDVNTEHDYPSNTESAKNGLMRTREHPRGPLVALQQRYGKRMKKNPV